MRTSPYPYANSLAQLNKQQPHTKKLKLGPGSAASVADADQFFETNGQRLRLNGSGLAALTLKFRGCLGRERGSPVLEISTVRSASTLLAATVSWNYASVRFRVSIRLNSGDWPGPP